MTNVHQTNISLHKMSKFTNINTWNSMKWAVFTTKKHMTSMKWAMFTKKHMTFHEMSNVHNKKHIAFHEIINIYQKTTHDLPWNEPCSPKKHITFYEMHNVHQKKHIIFHEFAWNDQQNIEQSAVLQVRGLMPFPQPLRWADGRWVLLVLIQWIFGGFCYIRRYDIIIICI